MIDDQGHKDQQFMLALKSPTNLSHEVEIRFQNNQSLSAMIELGLAMPTPASMRMPLSLTSKILQVHRAERHDERSNVGILERCVVFGFALQILVPWKLQMASARASIPEISPLPPFPPTVTSSSSSSSLTPGKGQPRPRPASLAFRSFCFTLSTLLKIQLTTVVHSNRSFHLPPKQPKQTPPDKSLTHCIS